ncbi:MAG TPA: ANTAR domain-containing protein [Paracoccus sp. (in: a-proteobacteria)]|uniref:ANTAR domain-containing response regulator n=1 Tax=uncultured Paracoccus sp. TaxID=189685 RepID=UPI002610EC2E|nr:ANTAR domain-containing protein [uncultured Paracoccus sp.]HMQ41963.1 ANTAR domain-containing protein [Paracoccus sp. (in: a-proteobacteria)]HMR35791.1 ANTAR domain-containing protein [Paracoccus sp. (in: a-proteobacteria)]
MTRRLRILDLAGARAAILHRPHATVTALERQLRAIGLSVESGWPDLPAAGREVDFLFFDVDMGFDAQFPWAPGQSPMPMIALIGSEAPGRIEWSLSHSAHAQLLKPVGDNGVYSALLIARAAFAALHGQAARISELQGRLAARETVVRAVMALMAQGMSDEDAFASLRRMATDRRESFEAAAARIIARHDDPQRNGGGQ